jgi:polysaccharide export outer membrane protein
MKKLIQLATLGILVLLVASSCVSRKKITYLQDKEGEPLEVDTAGYQKLRRTFYKVQVNDLLSIQFRSFNEEVDKYFNLQNNRNLGLGGAGVGGRGGGNAMLYFNGYTVNTDGRVKLPVLGPIYVNGLTVEEIEARLDKLLEEFFSDNSVFVKVRLSGIKYSVIGEGSNGQYFLFQNEANILEALANAGGVDFLGNRYEVQIVRMHPEGVKYYEVDLTDKRLISDPRYWVQPNDIINIKPLKQRSWGIGETGFQTFLALLSAVSSSLALIVAIQSFSR